MLWLRRTCRCLFKKKLSRWTCMNSLTASVRTLHETVAKNTAELILQYTELSKDHMTPEIGLYLITRNCALWWDRGDNSPFNDPFWAFYWPGGQVMSRYILDNPRQFSGKNILDFGSGCGASAIACKMVGANKVLANDIDEVAAEAIKLNSKENAVSVTTDTSNLIGSHNSDWNTIIVGDMFYDEAFRNILIDWLSEHYRRYKTSIFIGDPGRFPLVNHPIRTHLKKVSQYELSKSCQMENSGFTSGFVWKFEPN